MSQPAPSFWERSRQWPLRGQLAFALLVILIAGAMISAITNGWYGDPGSSGATHNQTTVPAPPPSLTTTTVASTTTITTRVHHPQTTHPSTTTRSSTTVSASSSPLIALRIATPSHEHSYDRQADFGGFIEVDGCKDTRAELLIRTSAVPVAFTRPSDCTVKAGRWTDPWSGVTTTIAHQFQIDHTVPLANAWRSGAWAWTHQERVAYANDLTDTDHLVPIPASENESKGDSGPDEWKPPNNSAWCTYAVVWDHIKAKWHLSATQAEWSALVAMAETC